MKIEGKTYETCLDSVLDCLEKLPHQRYELGSEDFKLSIDMMRLELRFFKMFFWGLSYWEDLEYDWHMRFAVNTMIPKLSQLAKEFVTDRRRVQVSGQNICWEEMVYDILEAIHKFMPHACYICLHFIRGDFKCTPCSSNQKKFLEYGRDTASLIDLIRLNLKILLDSYIFPPAPAVKQQLLLIDRELEEFGSFFYPPNRLFDLISRTRAWCNRVSCLVYLCRFFGSSDHLASLLMERKKMTSSTSGRILKYFQPTSILQSLPSYLDFLLKDLVFTMKDDTEMIQEGLVLLLPFIMEPPQDVEMIWRQIYSVVNEFPSLILSISTHGDIEGKSCKANFSDFLLQVDRVKAEVRNLCVATPYSSQFSSPSTNANKILEENVNMITSLKHHCEQLRKELVSLKPVVSNVMELQQDGNEEIKDLRTEIINIIYNADYLIKLCFPRSFSVWYRIRGLPDVIEQIKLMKIEISKLVGVDKMYEGKLGHHDQMEGTGDLPQLGTTSKMEKVFIGFREIQGLIIDDLTRGQESLTIVSISGLPGQGKTTLVKRIYNDPNVQHYFQKCVWCYVSKDCLVKEILLQNLSCDTNGGGVNEWDMNDLVERAWKSLKGRRYMIVMDDIWDVDSWRKLEWSFPDDKNGSLILFTSRNHDLVSQAKSNSISHPLLLFTDEETWELLNRSGFEPDDYSEEFMEIGKKIAGYCRGLPLAVVLISAVLRKTEQKLDLWNKVAENLKLHLAHEGCGRVIELSYSYLPDHLKP